MNKKLVVLAAFACDPNIASEPTIGWAYLRTWQALAQSARDLDVLVVMNQRSKIATDSRLANEGHGDPSRGLQTVGIELPRILKFLENPYLTRLEYLVWVFLARKYLAKLADAREVVLARHVTFASELLPTPISVLRKRAFTVWGPVGSSGVASVFRIPPRHAQWRLHFLFQKVRDVISRVQSRRIGRNVDLVLTTSQTLAADLQAAGISADAFPNTRLDPKFINMIFREKRSGPAADDNVLHETSPQLLCVGNLVYLKRFELAIATLSDPRLRRAQLRIIGKPAPGKENYLKAIAAQLRVADRVEFVGQLPQEEVVRSMIQADVLIHPSTREGGSGVVGEATAVGLPVVCFGGTGAAVVLEYAGGQGIQVDPSYINSVSKLSDAVVDASRMQHVPASVWQDDRYAEVEARLLAQALGTSKSSR